MEDVEKPATLVALKAKPNEEVIRTLLDLLKDTNEGKLHGVVVFLNYGPGGVSTAQGGKYTVGDILHAIELWKYLRVQQGSTVDKTIQEFSEEEAEAILARARELSTVPPVEIPELSAAACPEVLPTWKCKACGVSFEVVMYAARGLCLRCYDLHVLGNDESKQVDR